MTFPFLSTQTVITTRPVFWLASLILGSCNTPLLPSPPPTLPLPLLIPSSAVEFGSPEGSPWLPGLPVFPLPLPPSKSPHDFLVLLYASCFFASAAAFD